MSSHASCRSTGMGVPFRRLPAYIVEFYGLLGGGLRDANWDGSARPVARLAVLPGHTHYDIFASPDLLAAVLAFLDAPSLQPPAPLRP